MTLSDEKPSSHSCTNPMQAVDILGFVEEQEISSLYFETLYHLAPAPGDEKAYAILRETLERTRKIGIAQVVIKQRQHLAVLIPYGKVIVLNTLRCVNEMHCSHSLPPATSSADCMDTDTEELTPELPLMKKAMDRGHAFLQDDTFDDDLPLLMQQKIMPDAISDITFEASLPSEEDEDIDNALTRILKRSLHRQPAGAVRQRERSVHPLHQSNKTQSRRSR